MSSAGDTGAVGRPEFLEAMSRLQGRFDEAGGQVKSQEAEFDRDLDDAIARIEREPLSREGGALPPPVEKALHEAREIVDAAVIGWRERVGKYDRNTEFRRDHGDSLLVYVYGLVKAGKSALGNFVAHGCERPDDAFVATLSASGSGPEFFVRSVASGDPDAIDKANGRLARARRFHTDVEEATDRIQGFKMPGLTWIDSPGLGSVTEANGKLAREYVESADLVVVAMNSAQPGRRTERDEARRLMRLGKPMMVLLTRADNIDMDVDENGRIVKTLVMKSADDRRDMKEWVESQLKEAVRIEGRNAPRIPQITTISVRYAAEHPDIDGARESGLSELFGLLSEVAESEGVTMKREAPARMFRAFVRDIAGDEQNFGMGNIVGRLDRVRRSIARSREGHEEQGRQAGDRAARDIEAAINEEVESRRKTLDNAGLHEAVNRQARKILERRVSEAAAEMVKDIDMEMLSLAAMGQEHAPALKVVASVVIKPDRERREHLAFGAPVGLTGTIADVVIGFLFGGLVGAVAGAAAEAPSGATTNGSAAGSRVEYIDNAAEVAKELAIIKSNEVRKAASEAFARLNDEVLKPLETRIDNIIDGLEEFRSKWQKEIAR